MSDYYAVLGLAKGARAEAIHAAFRRLAKRHHPDAPGGDKERFHAIAEAHTALLKYTGSVRPPARRTLVSKFWKIAKSTTPSPVEGENVHVALHLSLEDALKGAVRRVTLPDGRALDVRCPPGCASHDIIRLKGAGNAGRHGGANGDALIDIQLLAHKRAVLKGSDIHLPLWLDLAQLRSGVKIEVSTPHGPLKVSIAPLSSHGQSVRLKGLGLPAYGKRRAGHLYFTLKVRRLASFSDALSRFNRIWANPLRSPVQPKA